MKKISFITLAGLAAFACAKSTVDLEVHTSPVDKDEPVEVGRTADIVLYASVDKDVETKLSASEKDGYVEFNFDENDEISTFFVSGDKKDVNVKFTYKEGKFVPGEDQLYTTLEGAMPEVYGIYPYEKDMSAVTNLTKVPVTIPQVQMYDPKQYTSNPRYPKDYCHFAAVPTTLIDEGSNAYSVDTKFYTMGSMIKFNVQNNTGAELRVRSVNIYGAPGLSGDFTANLTESPEYGNEDFKLEPVEGGNQYNHVCVSFGNEGFSLGHNYQMPLYAFVNAVDFDPSTEGFSMTVSTDKGTYEAIFEDRTADGFARNTRYTYTVTLDSGRKIDDQYVARYSNDGGKKWANAKSLKYAIYKITDSEEKSNGVVELLKDEKIDNIGGFQPTTNYYIALDNKSFTLNGNGHTLDISDRASNAFSNADEKSANKCDVIIKNIKVIAPEQGTKNSRFLYINNTESTVQLSDVHVVGVKNQSAAATTYGGAIYNKGTLLMENVKFKDCSSSTTGDGKYAYGGVIYNTGEGKLTINGLYVEGCSAMYGGVICNYSNSTTTISNAIIKSSCISNYGNALYNYGTMSIEDSEIEDSASAPSANSFTIYTNTTTGNTSVLDLARVNITTTAKEKVYPIGMIGNSKLNFHSGTITCNASLNGAILINAYTPTLNIGNSGAANNDVKIINTNGRCLYSYGTVNIYGGSFTSSSQPIYALSGKNGNSNLNIYGGTFTSSTSNAMYASKGDKNISVSISDGFFKSFAGKDVLNCTTGVNVSVKGGYFSEEVKADYLAEGYGCLKTDRIEDYPYEVLVPVTFQQEGGEVQNMASLEAAVDAANEATANCFIKLLEDYTVVSAKNITKSDISVTLDLNGKTLTQNGSNRLGISESGHLVVTDSKTGGKVTQNTSGKNVFSVSSGILDIQGGEIIQYSSGESYTIYNGGATLNISGKANIVGNRSFALYLTKGIVNISGGVISSDVAQTIYVKNSEDNLNVSITGGKILSEANTTENKYAVYVYQMIEGSSFTINGGDFRSNFSIVYSGNDNVVGLQVRKKEGVDEPYFYSFDKSSEQAFIFVRGTKNTEKTNANSVGCGYFGCTNGTWSINATNYNTKSKHDLQDPKIGPDNLTYTQQVY